MLNLNCVICAELFSPTDDVYVTKCGHMFHYSCLCQWLTRSKSCPQCRNKCTEANVHRVYFNLANLDTSAIDVGSLQEQLDNTKLKVQVTEKELDKAKKQVKSLKSKKKRCMKTISGLKQKVETNGSIIWSYAEQLKIVEKQSSILTSAKQDAEALTMALSARVSTLKRELWACENRLTNLRFHLKVVIDNQEEELDLKIDREKRLNQLESENFILTQKISLLEDKLPIVTFYLFIFVLYFVLTLIWYFFF